ncbi:hypothetical protein CVU37_00980 [candidate division BRC1 bacterium HGW-BRC1-1]|jgi:LAS superfamily LD-carboxypeptidase LdcB|nr:MAG: hypothetical protein CVU37_00980 [candidate division BRC1 bacterium HGW-BRC1-1]
MRFLWISFLILLPILALLIRFQSQPQPFADGRLVCLPMPPPLERLDVGTETLLKRKPVDLARLDTVRNGAAPSGGIQIVEPQPGNESLAMLRQVNQSDWGLARSGIMGESLASLAPVKVVQPVPVYREEEQLPTSVTLADTEGVTSEGATLASIDPGTTGAVIADAGKPGEVQPNLYLPEGAFDEESANLTLIKAELAAHEQPDVKSTASPFKLKEGDRVRPLTRLRNEKDFDWIRFKRDGKEWWAQAEYFIRVDPRNRAQLGEKNLTLGTEIVDKDSALPPVYTPDDLIDLPRDMMIDPKEIRVRKNTLDALKTMMAAAEKDGHKLRVFSGFRDFDYQKKLYLEAIARHGPKQNGTAAPGYSEHQLGTTVDISNTDRKYILSSRFGSTPEGLWLKANLEEFGFRHSYTQENMEEVGYKPEPWHIRYVGKDNLITPPERAVARK